MTLFFILSVSAFLLFAGVVAFGAPYLPTLRKRVDDALDLLDLKPGQTMLELGSGDGRLLKAAAKRGIHSVGYELNPLLVLFSRISTFKYRSIVTIKWRNYWQIPWPDSDGMYVFLLQPYMSKLHKKLIQYNRKKSYKLVSFGFEITEKKPTKHKNGMYLYTYSSSSLHQ